MDSGKAVSMFTAIILSVIGVLALLGLAYAFIGISVNGGRGWHPDLVSDFISFVAIIAILAIITLLKSVVEKKPIGKINEECANNANKLLGDIMLRLAMFQVNLTVWGIIAVAVSVVIFFIALKINLNVWGLINGETAGMLMLIISIILALEKPLVHDTAATKISSAHT